MRRIAGAVLVAVGLALTLAVIGAGGGGGYRVDAVFDRLSGLVPDQDVRVAGAKVGTIVEIGLTGDRKARVGMEVSEGFAPFRADARCTIRQDSLLGEKFVQCDPGSPDAPPLRGKGGGPPAVPVDRTDVPIDIDLILDLSRRSYRERLRILLNELGVGLAGRGDDLNAAIRRVNPALRETNEVLSTVARDRKTIRRLLEGTDAALAELARRRGRVKSFVERADRATAAVAGRRDDLEEAIRRLPPLLAELEPSADRLAAFARETTPALRDLQAAAPAVNAVLGDVEPLSAAARPALRALGDTARVGRRAIRSGRPVARRLGAATREFPEAVRIATELVESLRGSGGIEGIMRFTYYGTAAAARFDSVSHIFPTFQLLPKDCARYATTPREGCSAHFGGATGAAPSGARKAPRRAGRRAPARGRRPGDREAPATGTPAPPRPEAPASPLPRVPIPGLPGPRPDPSIPLLDWLFEP